MFMLGTLANTVCVAIAGILGTLLKKGIPERITSTVLHGMALCVMFIGISGALDGENILIAIISLGVGAFIGELIDIEKHVNRLGNFIQSKVKVSDGQGSVAEGFVNCTLLFCVGSMAIVGAIEDAMGDPDTLLAKTVIDTISCFIMATTLGIGCAFSSLSLLLYQGSISVLALLFLSDLPDAMLNEISCVGSLIIIAIGLNMLGVTKIRTANLIPAIFLPLILCLFM